MNYSKRLLLSFISLLFFCGINAQGDLKTLVLKLKADVRGPYKDIRWFCDDGTTRPAKEPCGEIGGNQRARYKDEVENLGRKQHLFLGQILAGTQDKDFWDKEYDNSRIKQYLIERYLFDNDDGWIQRKSQYYRGAFQAEDEEEWGKAFFIELFSTTKVTEDNFLLIREALKTIPHGGDNNSLFKIRAISKDMAELDPSFESIRIKIHGNPQASDSLLVKNFKAKKENPKMTDMSVELLREMRLNYRLDFAEAMKSKIRSMGSFAELKQSLSEYVQLVNSKDKNAVFHGIDLLKSIKEKLFVLRNPKDKLLLFDMSILIERFVLQHPKILSCDNFSELIESACYLGELTTATGYLNDWEMEELLTGYSSRITSEMNVYKLEEVRQTLNKNINWSSSLFLSHFEKDINRFGTFEPMAYGFYDDRIRSSALLTLGSLAQLFTESLNRINDKSQSIFGKKRSDIEGLNPGIAKGKLYIGSDDIHEVDRTGIYLFQKAPADLEPVAGILSVSEGNMVSHLQLLARNLGIPNARIDKNLFDELSRFASKEVFYAASANGNVILKEASKMSKEENALFKVNTIDDEIIEIPIAQMKLDQTKILDIRDISATATGVVCGPKAGNFAELKRHFPDNLVEGIVIPFGVFKAHMLQQIPKRNYSYWSYLENTFNGKVAEDAILKRLDTLRTLIAEMPFIPEFVKDLEASHKETFGKSLGQVPVFLRSDTNMEDLKDFTGAGLNLTVFNVSERARILQGIKDVWASPYSERSYKWRQKYLKNPEHVYPSILVIPSVYVDRSGVIISKNIKTGYNYQITAAMSRGVGGAVDGQNAETRILSRNLGHELLFPSRDRSFKTLTAQDGTIIKACSLGEAIFTTQDYREIWKMLATVYEEIPKTGMAFPYDIEFGFVGDKLWIFQIRPFVENKKAGNISYLQALNGKPIEKKKIVDLYQTL